MQFRLGTYIAAIFVALSIVAGLAVLAYCKINEIVTPRQGSLLGQFNELPMQCLFAGIAGIASFCIATAIYRHYLRKVPGRCCSCGHKWNRCANRCAFCGLRNDNNEPLFTVIRP